MTVSSQQSSPTVVTCWIAGRFLGDTATALSSIALTSLLAGDRLLAATAGDRSRPAICPASRAFPRARRRTCWSSSAPGRVSQLETWDYKPELIKHDGKPLAGGPAVTFQGPAGELARPQYRVPSARPDRQDGLGHDSAPGRAHRRFRVRPFIDEQEQHARARRRIFYRPASCSMAFRASARGSLTRSAARARIFPRSSQFPIRAGSRKPVRTTGVPASCPPHFKGRPSVTKEPVRHLAAPGHPPAADGAARVAAAAR